MNDKQRIDLHMHTFLSDGVLLPSELIRRAVVQGYKALAITDHADASNLATLISSLQSLLRQQSNSLPLDVIIGVELTHVPPDAIADLARAAKRQGAELVVVHGETIVEPVAPGTNRAAIASPHVDILAHPGFITPKEAALAAERGCAIEITTRKGHSLTNGHVARICQRAGANLVVNSDAHAPGDLADQAFAQRVAAGAGLNPEQIERATVTVPQEIVSRILAARRPLLKA